jgi:hypothetical protein
MELQRRMVAVVEKLLTAADLLIQELDVAAPDADLEPDLGAADRAGGHPWTYDQRQWACGQDAEPWLGAAERGTASQVAWAVSGSDDREDDDAEREEEHDGREPECEDEGAQCEDEGFDSDGEPESGW